MPVRWSFPPMESRYGPLHRSHLRGIAAPSSIYRRYYIFSDIQLLHIWYTFVQFHYHSDGIIQRIQITLVGMRTLSQDARQLISFINTLSVSNDVAEWSEA